jgi:hypothetical protein
VRTLDLHDGCLSPKLNAGTPAEERALRLSGFSAGLRREAPDYCSGKPSFYPFGAGSAFNSSICRNNFAFSRSKDSRDRNHIRIR